VRAHILQYEPFEGPGSIATWLDTHQAVVTTTCLYRGNPQFPVVEDFDWLIVLGGGMSVNDETAFPWLVAEKAYVRRAIDGGKIVLGVCLGAQMIAAVLGSRVHRNAAREIGWFPIAREPDADRHPMGKLFPEECVVFHWHGETFDLPPGAVRLVRSAACLNQAFVWGDRVLGLQLHLEATPASARALIGGLEHELVPGPFVQDAAAMLSQPQRFDQANRLMDGLLGHLAEIYEDISGR